MAVTNAVSAATIIFTAISIIFFFIGKPYYALCIINYALILVSLFGIAARVDHQR